MTAPGLNLEFTGGPGFWRRAKAVPGLPEACRDAIKMAPPVKGLQAWDLRYNGKIYGVVLHRSAQRVSFLYVFALPSEEALFRAKLRELGPVYDALEGP